MHRNQVNEQDKQTPVSAHYVNLLHLHKHYDQGCVVFCRWFRTDLSASDAERVLRDHDEGCFVARDSFGSPGDFALSIKVGETVQHVLVKRDQQDGSCNIFFMFDIEKFPSLEKMVSYYQQSPMFFSELNKEVLLTKGIVLPEDVDYDPFEEEFEETDFTCNSVDFSALGFEQEAVLLQEVMQSDCIVLAIGHSELSVNGQKIDSTYENVACVVKDKAKKGFFIRIIDLKKQCVLSDKKIDRRFEYDNPKPLVMSYISDRGLTTIGFESEKEATNFQNEVDGCMQRELDRVARKRAASKANKATARKKGNEMVTVDSSRRWLKAADFDIDNISPEWQELFELSGVTRQDLEDANTLQFILDFVASQGGLSGETNTSAGKTATATENSRDKPAQKAQSEDVMDSGLGSDAVVGMVRRRTGSRSLGKERRTLIAQQLNKRLTQLSA